MQRRKLLFEYGLEKKIQSQAAAPQASGFPATAEQTDNAYNSKSAAKTGSVQKTPANPAAALQQARHGAGAAPGSSFGAVKGSSLGHYPHQGPANHP